MGHEKIFWASSLGTWVTNLEVLPIKGLYFVSEYLSFEEEDRLVKLVDGNSWAKVIKRRQQFYGDVYYHTKSDLKELQPQTPPSALPSKSSTSNHQGPLDGHYDDLSQISWLTEKCIKSGFFGCDEDLKPDQVLVNEYVNYDGIRSHYDDSKAFGPVIVTVSIGSPVWLTLKRPKHSTNSCQDILEMTKVYVPPRSCLVYAGDARYGWRHGISKTKYIEDPIGHPDGSLLHRNDQYRRISFTIRKLLQGRKRVSQDKVDWEEVDCNQVLCPCYHEKERDKQ